MYVQDEFSPYLDPEPIAEFFDDVGQRSMVTGLLAFVVHVLIFMILQTRLDIPHIPNEQEPIIVEIISFQPQAEPEPEPEPEADPEPELRPAVSSPIQAPMPKPQPQPQLIPPPPEQNPEQPPVFAPPAPEIIKTLEPEPELQAPPDPEPQPEPLPEPLPEPSLDLFDPELVTQTDPYLAPEPLLEVYEPVAEAVKAPETFAPLFEPNILEHDADPEELPEIDELSELAPALPAPALLFQQGIVDPPPNQIQEQIDPELTDTPDIEVAAKPPTILASPEAPTTQAEAKKAIPQEQAGEPASLSKPSRPFGRPSGGGNEVAPAYRSSTPRVAPGAQGWQAIGDWPADGLHGGKGIIRDIDCRGEKRDHEDCPEYIRKNEGRSTNGFESFDPHTPLGTSTVPPSRGIAPNISITPTFGDPGFPSGSVLQDAGGFKGQFRGDKVVPRDQGHRVRDLFNPPDPAPWTTKTDLPPPLEEDELIVLKKPK